MAEIFSRMVSFRIDKGDDGSVHVTRTYTGSVSIFQEGTPGGVQAAIEMSDEVAALVIKALADILAEGPPTPQRRQRIDIGEGIVEFLRGGPHSIKELAAGLERKPSQIQSAIVRLMNAGQVEANNGSYQVTAPKQAEVAE